jgi:pyridoxal phosphate enzyme (YggS family)
MDSSMRDSYHANMSHPSLENLSHIEARIRQAADRAQRDATQITLVAVSKTYDAADIAPVLQAGQRHFGENRVQEAQAKWPALKAAYPDVTLHLIGSLQTNKAEQAVALFDMIHVLDRPSLAEALAKAMLKLGRHLPCFVQVNIGSEPQKGGCDLAALPDLLDQSRALGLMVTGLMCLPPANQDPAPYFAALQKLAADHQLPHLSMGMSSDYETAIQNGATHVRVGSALFGARS